MKQDLKTFTLHLHHFTFDNCPDEVPEYIFVWKQVILKKNTNEER